MDGLILDVVPSDGDGAALIAFVAELPAAIPTTPVLAVALVILIVVAGLDAARPEHGPRR